MVSAVLVEEKITVSLCFDLPSSHAVTLPRLLWRSHRLPALYLMEIESVKKITFEHAKSPREESCTMGKTVKEVKSRSESAHPGGGMFILSLVL